MISALIPTLNSACDLQRLLSALVPAAVAGVVREVVVADGGSTDATLAICEDAGAQVVQGALAAAAMRAKSDWLLVLPVTLRLRAGWEQALGEHLQLGGGRARIDGLSTGDPFAWLKRREAGLLVQRAALEGLGETRDVAGLRRRLARGAEVLR